MPDNERVTSGCVYPSASLALPLSEAPPCSDAHPHAVCTLNRWRSSPVIINSSLHHFEERTSNHTSNTILCCSSHSSRRCSKLSTLRTLLFSPNLILFSPVDYYLLTYMTGIKEPMIRPLGICCTSYNLRRTLRNEHSPFLVEF